MVAALLAMLLLPAAAPVVAGAYLLLRAALRPAAAPAPELPALLPAPEPAAFEGVRRGDLVDLEGTPFFAVVQAVDGEQVWCLLVQGAGRTESGEPVLTKGRIVWRWPLAELNVLDRGYRLPGGD